MTEIFAVEVVADDSEVAIVEVYGMPLTATGDALTTANLDQFADVTQTSGKTLAITGNTTLAGGTYAGNVTGNNTGDQDLSGLVVKANNLSDLANATVARQNLGLGNASLVTLSGNTTTFLRSDGQQVEVATGSGNVTGPATIADNAIVRWNANETQIQSSSATITDSGNLTLGSGNISLTGQITNSGATVGSVYICQENGALTLLTPPLNSIGNSTLTYNHATNTVSWSGATLANTTRLIIDGAQGLDDLSDYNVTLTAEGDATANGTHIVFSGDGCIDIDADFDLGVGAEPFQIEGFVTMADLTAGGLLLISHGGGAAAWNSSNGHQYILGFVDSGTLELKCDWWNGSGISSASVPLFDGEGNATTALANGTQTYVCVNYDGTNLRVYIDDTRYHQGAATFGGTSAATLLRLGKTASGDQNLTGSIEHFRVQMGAGISVHTAATITVPTPPFTD